MSTPRTLGLGLKVKRIRAGVKQYELAGQLGIPVSALSEMEGGRREVSPEMRRKIKETIEALRDVRVT